MPRLLLNTLRKVSCLVQILPVSSVSTTVKPLLGVGQKPVPCTSPDTEVQGTCPDSSGLPDVSSNGSLMSARSLGRPHHSNSAAQQPQATAAATAAFADAGSNPASVTSCAAGVNAANVRVTQAGAFPVRQGSDGTSRPGLMPRRSLTTERFPVNPKSLGSRRSPSLVKQPSDPLAFASMALQLTGAPLCDIGGHAAGQGAQLPSSSGSSVSSGADKLVRDSSLYSSQPSERVAASCVTDSHGGSIMPPVPAPAPRRNTSIRLGNV